MGRAFAAYTAYPNTPESDKPAGRWSRPEVLHLVDVRDDLGRTSQVKIMASDPITAIDKVNKQLEE